MRLATEQMFKTILKDESYTWDELAELFAKECRKEDIEEFIMLLEEHIK